MPSVVHKSIIAKSVVHVPSVDNATWSQFCFYQVDNEWQRRLCSKVGLPYCSTYERPIGSSSTILTRPDRQSVKVMLGDGNCLFRSFSFVLSGSQQHHLLVHNLICNHMPSIIGLLLPHIYPHSCVEDYITNSKMNYNNFWGTNVEILTFANLCQTNVYVYSVDESRWNVFPPSCSLRNRCGNTICVFAPSTRSL